MIISRSDLRRRSVADKSCKDNQNTHFIFKNFVLEIRAIYEKMWKNFIELGMPQIKIWHMNIACWITKATNIQSEYVIIIAFPLQQLLGERVYVLRYMHIACPVICLNPLSLRYGSKYYCNIHCNQVCLN
jgi:hypothetical protein